MDARQRLDAERLQAAFADDLFDAIEARRTSYNSLVTANGAGADFIIDQAADATMGVYPTSPNNTALYADNIHPTSSGYALLAPIFAAGING